MSVGQTTGLRKSPWTRSSFEDSSACHSPKSGPGPVADQDRTRLILRWDLFRVIDDELLGHGLALFQLQAERLHGREHAG